MSSSVVPEEGFDLTENIQAVPVNLLDAPCNAFYVDFLRLSAPGTSIEGAKNHVVIKVDFLTRVAGFRGVRISMDVNQDLASTPSEDGGAHWKPGKMLVKPLGYRGASRSSARIFQLPLAEGLILQNILEVFIHNNMQDFSFQNLSDRYYGCRDFMYVYTGHNFIKFDYNRQLALTERKHRLQGLNLLANAGLVGSTIERAERRRLQRDVNDALDVSNIFYILGLRFVTGSVTISLIDRGRFWDYIRVEETWMPYSLVP